MLKKALEALQKPGAVLLVPTETVYGLVCDWADQAARDRIYAMKHRAENKPLAAFVPPRTRKRSAAVRSPKRRNASRNASCRVPSL